MINNSMNNSKIVINSDSKSNVQPKNLVVSKPNELGGVHISSSLKIFDPNTKQVILHKRADS